jgi:membrane protein YdbS with pleckstrin-like domain
VQFPLSPATLPGAGKCTMPETLRPTSIADGRERGLHPNEIIAARISGGITAAVVAFALLVAAILLVASSFLGRPFSLLALLGWLGVAVALGALSFSWPAVRHRHISFRVDERGIRIRRGVFWRTETSVPKSRVQHTDVSRGPIERGLDLATLIIHTAGTEQASVSLSGLPHDDAYRIRDFLIEGGEGDAV